MISIKSASERGSSDLGWLKSHFSFSFADYHDPENMGVSALRVINEDYISAGQGFGTHPHKDMEIISYVLEGSIEHKDSMGNGSVVRPGEVQRMSAGTGVSHSEFNPSATESTHMLQIWIQPDRTGHEPSYEQKVYNADQHRQELTLIASPEGANGSVSIHQDAFLYATRPSSDMVLHYDLAHDRVAYLHVVRGSGVGLGPNRLKAGDAATILDEDDIAMDCIAGTEILVFDLPKQGENI